MRKVLQRLYSVFMVVVVEIEFSIWYLGYAFLCSSYKRVSFKIIAITWPFSAVTILNAAQVCQVLQVYWWVKGTGILHSLLRLCALFTTLQGFWWFDLSFSCYSTGPSFFFSAGGLPRICQRKGKRLNISNVECCRTDFCNMDLKPTLATFFDSGMDLFILENKNRTQS